MSGLIWMSTGGDGKLTDRRFPREFARQARCLHRSLQFDGERLTHAGDVVDLERFSHFVFLFHETDSPHETMLSLVRLESWLRTAAAHIRIVNPPSRARFLGDKLWQYSALRKAGLSCPDFWPLDSPEAVEDVRFPALLRDPVTHSGRGIRPVPSSREARMLCGAEHRYRMAVEAVDTRVRGRHVRYRALTCGPFLLNVFRRAAGEKLPAAWFYRSYCNIVLGECL